MKGLRDLEDNLSDLVADASDTAQGAPDTGSMVSLYNRGLGVLHSGWEESRELRAATSQVRERGLRDSAVSVADSLDEDVDFGAQAADLFVAAKLNPATPTPNHDEVSHKVLDVVAHTGHSLQRFEESYRKTCGTDAGIGDIGSITKNLGVVDIGAL